jgi:hypothetical protein
MDEEELTVVDLPESTWLSLLLLACGVMTRQGRRRRATYDDDDVDMSLVVLTEDVVSISKLIESES